MLSLSLRTSEGGIKETSINTVLCVSDADLLRELLSSNFLTGVGQGGTSCRSMEHGFCHISPISPFLYHFWTSHFVWCGSASGHYSLWEELPCIPDPRSVFGFSLCERTETKKIHVHVQPTLIDCSLAMKQFSVPIMSLQMTEAI